MKSNRLFRPEPLRRDVASDRLLDNKSDEDLDGGTSGCGLGTRATSRDELSASEGLVKTTSRGSMCCLKYRC